jgi:urea carboxylase
VFAKVLVANRGEIACRIIKTLHRLGVRSVQVYSDADVATMPVRMADEVVRIGPAPPSSSYLDGAAIISAAVACGAEAIHPGYGFLAERADFAEAVENAGLAFIGPTPAQLRRFGSKHLARELAAAAHVPLAPASGLLGSVDDAVREAATVGYPVVIKATAGGGGIGMRVCADNSALEREFDAARRQARAAFGDGGLYVERYLATARHVEVQIAGDGTGRVMTLGDRDCSVQRRHQKVIEESPAPFLTDDLRATLHAASVRLATDTGYRSVGTVEFLVDVGRDTAAFLEVNTRLQVEHTVTEAVYGIDLVEWMLRIAAGDASMFDDEPIARGCAAEVRVCAENPWQQHQPSAGTLTTVAFPDGVRVDTWIDAGTEVTSHYDSLLAKVVATGETRDVALDRLEHALQHTRIEGVATNVDLLRTVLDDPDFRAGRFDTQLLARTPPKAPVVEVLAGGTQSTVQDHPGRIGLWAVGVPPSGPMDDLSFRLGNRAVGNPEGAPGIELTVSGPRLRFHTDALVCITGAPANVDLGGTPVPMWEPIAVADGSVLTVADIGPPGMRAYLLVRGGIDVPSVLGSASTFTLGQFGGHAGRALRVGDILHVGTATSGEAVPSTPPPFTRQWELAVLEGPHADPEFLTADDLDAFYAASWRVHHNSARTGVRLVGPSPRWARPDGGEAGLHPSNIHDTPYAVGAVDFTGDMPILLGPDGPSLGGFVCPAVVTVGDRWKLGQLRPEDTVRFVAVGTDDADARRATTATGANTRSPSSPGHRLDAAHGVLDRWEADGDRPLVTWRRSGDDYVLVEYGPMVLDLGLRFRVSELQQWLEAQALDAVLDITPGIRSLQVHFDPDRLPEGALVDALQAAEAVLPSARDAMVESRIVHLPLSWDDPATREAIDRYMSTVRSDAPWCPWNIEFIRRINGLADVAEVHRTVFDASYLVLGLGDVYLGAPVATPLDPRHRLVTTKYNPARTWTPENAVGIGGAYLCIYGMEGPGGYQFVGRTVPVWNRFRATSAFTEPWLLRFFDRLRFFEVSAAELLEWRRDMLTGRAVPTTEPGTLRLGDHLAFCADNARGIGEFRARQQAAFNEERARWAAAEMATPQAETRAPVDKPLPEGASVIESALLASVWKVLVGAGDRISEGDAVVVLESMKLETTVHSPLEGTVAAVMVRSGQEVVPGQALLAVVPR